MNTIAEGFHVEPADPGSQADRAAIIALREAVLVDELGASPDLAWDDSDPHCGHVLARDPSGLPLGCARLDDDGQIGRLVVTPAWRERGVGGALLIRLIDLARQRRMAAIQVHADLAARGFYQHYGFVETSAQVIEGGSAHATMRCDLGKVPPLERSAPPPGAESPEIELDGIESCREALGLLLADAGRQLCIYTRAMDPDLFRGEALFQNLRRIATAGRGAEIRILVQDPDSALHDGAALLSLAQRLTSSMPLRQPADATEAPFAGAYVINDAGGLLFRPIGSRFEGSFQRRAPGRHRQLLEQFNQAWDRAGPASSLRAQAL